MRFRRAPGTLARPVGEGLEVEHPEAGQHQLSSQAATLWQLLEVPQTLPELSRRFAARPLPRRRSEEVEVLLDHMLCSGIVEEVIEVEG
jgi:hypothetical protein